MSLLNQDKTSPHRDVTIKGSPSEQKKPRSNSSGSNSSGSSSVGNKDKTNEKRLSTISLTIDWKEDMEDSEETDEALRTSLHCFDDLYHGLTMIMIFRQTDLATGKLVLNMQLERTVKSFLKFYHIYCKFHNMPNGLRLEEEIQSYPIAGHALGDNHEELKTNILKKIQTFFNCIITIHGGYFWDDSTIVDFIDEDLERQFSTESMLTLRCEAAHSEVYALESNVEYWNHLIESAQQRINKLSAKLRGRPMSVTFPTFNLAALQNAAAAVLGSSSKPTRDVGPDQFHVHGEDHPSFSTAVPDKCTNNDTKNSGDRGTIGNCRAEESITSEVTVDMRECMYETSFVMPAWENSFDTNFFESNRGTENSVLTNSFSNNIGPPSTRVSSNIYNQHMKPSISGSSMAITPHVDKKPLNNSVVEVSKESSTNKEGSYVDSKPLRNDMPVSNQISVELLKIVLTDLVYESAVDEVVEIVSFTTKQTHANRIAFFTKHFHISSTTRLFDIGLQAIDFALFDDEMKVSFVGDASASTVEGNEFYSVDQSVTNSLRPYSSTKKNKETMVRDEAIGDHSIGFNPQNQTKPNVFVGTLDTLPFSFHFQEHVEACLLLMFDEINTLVGKNDLVRKTVRLIRAWWMQESITYVGVSIKQYLTNSAFLLMITVIFNKYYHLLNTPFQAFCFFFAEFSSWNPSTQLVTIEGLVDVGASSIKPVYNGSLLLDSQFIKKYQSMLSVESSVELDSVKSAACLADIGVYIVNPLNGANLIVDKMSANQVARFPKAIQGGATNLSVFLKQLIVTEDSKNNSNKSSILRNPELINNYFPNILTTFAERTEEILNQSKEPSGLKTSFVDAKSQLRQCVAYGNFVNSGIVEKESVLFVASKLLQQGPGSQRCSDIVSLCVERVMGPGAKESPSFPSLLSNFISILRDEANDQNFIIVDDNPSDPFVVSKDGFTQNQLNLITRGLVAPQAIVEMQKANVNLKQDFSTASDAQSLVSINSQGSFDSSPANSAQVSLSQRTSGSGGRRSMNQHPQQQHYHNNNNNNNSQRSSFNQATSSNSSARGSQGNGNFNNNSNNGNPHSGNSSFNNNGSNNHNNRSYYQNSNFHNNTNFGNFNNNNHNFQDNSMGNGSQGQQYHQGGGNRHTFGGFQNHNQNYNNYDDNNSNGQFQRNSFGNNIGRGGGGNAGRMGNRNGRFGNNQQGGRGYNGGRYAHSQQQNFQGGNGNRGGGMDNNGGESLQMQQSSWLDGF